MKIRRNVRFNNELYNEFIEYCDKHKYKYSSLIGYILAKDFELINSDKVPAIRSYEEKKVFQINVDEDIYDALRPSKVARIEWAVKRFLKEQQGNEHGIK